MAELIDFETFPQTLLIFSKQILDFSQTKCVKFSIKLKLCKQSKNVTAQLADLLPQKIYFASYALISLAGNQLWFIVIVPFHFIAENYKCALAE